MNAIMQVANQQCVDHIGRRDLRRFGVCCGYVSEAYDLIVL